jgi:excisionase family DNA binding protein
MNSHHLRVLGRRYAQMIEDKLDKLESLGVSVKTAARSLEVCDRTVWNLIARGDLRTFGIGDLVRIPPEDIRAIAAKAKSRKEVA